MVNQEVVDYIKQNLAKGFTRDQIYQTLLSAGNSEQDINECFELVNLAEQSMVKTKEIENQLQRTTNNVIQQSNSEPQTIEKEQTPEVTQSQQNNADNTSNESSQQPQTDNQQPTANNQQPQTEENKSNSKKVKLSLPMIGILIVCVTALGIGLFFANNMLNQNISGGNEQQIIDESITDSEQEQFEEIEIPEEPDGENDQDTIVSNQTTDTRCRIAANVVSLNLDVGVTRGLVASGYLGDVFDVSWKIEDSTIGRMMPPIGSASAVTALSPGNTRIIVTDNSVDSDCVYYIGLNVAE